MRPRTARTGATSAALVAAIAVVGYLVLFPSIELTVWAMRTAPTGVHDLRQAADAAFERGDYDSAGALYNRIAGVTDHPVFVLLREECAWGRADNLLRTLVAGQRALWEDDDVSLVHLGRCGRREWADQVAWAPADRPLLLLVGGRTTRVRALIVRLKQTDSSAQMVALGACLNVISGAPNLGLVQWQHYGGFPKPTRRCDRLV